MSDGLTLETRAMLYDVQEETLRLHVGTSRWALRVSMGRLDENGEFHENWPDAFLVLAGRRWPRGD